MNAFFVLKSQATLNQLKPYAINMMYSSIISNTLIILSIMNNCHFQNLPLFITFRDYLICRL
jgi:hypothetical protein